MPYVFPAGDVVHKPQDIIAIVCNANAVVGQPGMSPDDWRPVTACAIQLAESGGDPLAVSPRALWQPGKPTHLSLDLGPWQLNSYYNTVTGPYPDVPPISMADCFDPVKAWIQTWKIINKGRTGWNYNWSAWTTYNTGAYDKHVSTALAGMRAYRVAMGLPPGVFG